MKSRFLLLLTTAVILTVLGCGLPIVEKPEHNKQLLLKSVEAMNKRNWVALDSFIDSNYVRHCQATPDVKVNSLADFKAFLKQDSITCPDSRIQIDHMVADDSLIGFFCTYEGTQTGPMGAFPPSNKKVDLKFAGVHLVKNGKIAETWLTWDNMTVLNQLGYWPPPKN